MENTPTKGEENKKYFRFVDSLLRIAENLQDRFNRTLISKERLPVEAAVLCFQLVKSYKTARAVVLLCQEGYQEDGLILVRSVFESALWILDIFADGEKARERAQAYVYGAVLQKCQKVRTVYELHKEDDAAKRELGKLLGQLESEVSRIRKEYEGRTDALKYGRKSVEDLAKHAKLHYLYPTFYWESSLYAHSAPGSSLTYVTESEKHLHFLAAPGTERTPDVLLPLSDFVLRILKAFDSFFGFETHDILSSKRRELDDLMNSRAESI